MDNNLKRQMLRQMLTGVYVLTSCHAERYGAATITWASQASFQPALIVAAVGRQSSVFRCLEQSGIAVLHVVGERQCDIARRFCCPTEQRDGPIDGEPFVRGKTSAPVLTRMPAYFECEVERIVATEGDHALVILRIVEAQCRSRFRPLTIADFRSYLDAAPVPSAGRGPARRPLRPPATPDFTSTGRFPVAR